MRIEEDVELIASLLDRVGLLNVDDDFVSYVRCGDIDAINIEYGDTMKIDSIQEAELTQLEKKLRNYCGKDNEDKFWDALCTREILPFAFEALCIRLFSQESTLFDHGLHIYTILLGMNAAYNVWNTTLFEPVLKSLTSAYQLLENGVSNESAAEVRAIFTTAKAVLFDLAFAMRRKFLKIISRDELIALIEITVKLMRGHRQEMDIWNSDIGDASMSLLAIIMKDQIDLVLPFLVPTLLLQFTPSSSSTITQRIDRLRQRLLDFTLENFPGDDPRMTNFCKHLIVRAPEKAHLRKNAAYVVLNITEASSEPCLLIDFVLRYARTGKATSRAFAVHLLQLYILRITELMKDNTEAIPEFVIKISSTIKKLMNDTSPTVRAAALDSMAQIISGITDSQYTPIVDSVFDRNGALVKVDLEKRIIDDKLAVRRAALNCVGELIKSAPKITDDLLNLVSGRIRDRALSIRQQAIKILNAAIDIFPEDEILRKTWLDSILPLIVDIENTVQNEAFDAVRKKLFEPIEQGMTDVLVQCLGANHFDFMKNVFQLYKQKAVSLAKLSKALTDRIIDNFHDTASWKLLNIISSVEASHLKTKIFRNLWGDRNELPPEYFHILCNLKCVDEEIHNDSIDILNDMLVRNDSEYKRVHSIVALLRVQTDGDDSTWKGLIEECCKIIGNVVQSAETTVSSLYGLLTTIYTLGELVLSLKDENTKSLSDFDFSAVEVLMNEVLPNQVTVPSQVRSMAAATVGKVCVRNRNIATNLVDAFAGQLASDDAPLKCNCLVALCDLCIVYSALVDPHTKNMSNCFTDESPNVRRQTLHLITKLITEDYVKMTNTLFFKYVYAITDEDDEIASFAQSCLFNVILAKYPGIIGTNFIPAIYYYSGEMDISTLQVSPEEARRFVIKSEERRRKGITLLISKLDDVNVFNLVGTIFKKVLTKYINDEFSLKKHANILSDCIFSLVALEDKMKATSENEVLTDNMNEAKVIEAGKRMINDIHNNMIQQILPILNNMHRLLRMNNSRHQSLIKEFYQRIIAKHPALMEQIQRTEPVLADELAEEMSRQPIEEEEEPDETVTPPSTPKRSLQFTSPILTRIATTPRSMLCTPERSNSTPNLMTTPRKYGAAREFSTPTHSGIDLD